MPGISPDILKDKLFRIKKLEFNTYEVDNPNVKGTLRLVSIPMNILEIPDNLIPPERLTPGLPAYAIAAQTLVGFTNKGKKGQPSTKVWLPDEIKKAKKIDITSFAQDSAFEPWNEFVVQGNPPILVKQRTILTKLEWIMNETNQFGDPFLWANTNTSSSVSVPESGEAGLS